MARVTLKIIAKKAGISYPNVSKIINNKPVFVSQENREKVLAIAREFNYSPNQFAQSLKTGRTNIIGFSTGTVNITSLFQDPYLSNVCTGVADALAQHKYKLIFHYFPRVAEGQSPDIATNQTVDGLIFSLFAHAVDIFLENRLAGRMEELSLPFVVVHSLTRELPFPNIGCDCRQGAFDAATHLLEHGYGSVGFVCRPVGANRLYQDIYTGYQEALQAKGMTVNQDHIYTLPAEIDNPGSVLAKDMIAKKNLPRALFIADEGAANNMVAGFKNAGISIPDDLAIIVFGNDINEQYYATELTTIQQPGRGKGKQAVEMVMDMIEHPERINESRQEILKLALKVRTSCGCGN